jgi:hypothetical protein
MRGDAGGDEGRFEGSATTSTRRARDSRTASSRVAGRCAYAGQADVVGMHFTRGLQFTAGGRTGGRAAVVVMTVVRCEV